MKTKIFIRLTSLCLLAIPALLVGGCSTVPAPISPLVSVEQPDVFEKEAFEVVADFYCSNKRWPVSWVEVEDFQRSRGREVVWLEAVEDPKLSSSRAIFFTLKYVSAEAKPRRATYIAPPHCGKDSVKGIVSIAAEGVVFELPAGFELLPAKEVQKRWKAPPYPDAAWGTSDGKVLAIRFGDLQIKPDELPQFAKDMAEAYEASIPSLVWTFKDSKNIGGKPVLYHEFKSTASTGPLINVVFSGVFDRHLFAITLTGPMDGAAGVVQAARQVESSLKIR